MKKGEKKDLLAAIRALEQYQAVYEDRAEVYADVACAIAGLKGDFERILENAEKETKE